MPPTTARTTRSRCRRASRGRPSTTPPPARPPTTAPSAGAPAAAYRPAFAAALSRRRRRRQPSGIRRGLLVRRDTHAPAGGRARQSLVMDFALGAPAEKYRQRYRDFVRREVVPLDTTPE